MITTALRRIDKKLKIIEDARPLSPRLVQKLKEQFSFELTYNSNAIEGNRLTLKETYFIINDGITVKGKSLKDHLEAKNHHEAIHYLYEMIEHQKRHTVSEHLIRSLQQLIIKDIEENETGLYSFRESLDRCTLDLPRGYCRANIITKTSWDTPGGFYLQKSVLRDYSFER